MPRLSTSAFRFAFLALCSVPLVALAQDPANTQYTAKVLMRNLFNPTSITFLPDGRLYVTQKNGVIRLIKPSTGDTSTAATLPTANVREDGLHSLVLDPDFAVNRRVYVLMSERSSGDTALVVARYATDSASGALLTGTRATLLKIPYTLNSGTAEHNTGMIAFGPGGNLYIALADNTQNIFSGTGAGYAPRDTARPLYDARRSAANTNDLRGKILRIHPEENGTYSIPAGNLKDSINLPAFNPNWNGSEDDLAKVRPEIFVMGLRHPFRMTIDPATGWLYWAEPGPNASADNASQGPRGYEVISMAKGPGNYGWPFCRANPTAIQKPGGVTTPYFCYTEYNYSGSGTAGAMFNPNALRNKSKNNTGIVNLPPMRPAMAWYPYNSTGTLFPQFGNGSSNTGMLGPVYHYDPSLSAARLPSVFDDHLFLVEWGRNLLFVAGLDSAGGMKDIRAFRDVGGARDSVVNGPIDIKVGPDGALYFLNWGNSTYPANSNAIGSLSRLAYIGTHVPVMMVPARRGGLLGDRLFVAGPGVALALPPRALGAELYSLRGERLWSWHPAEGGERRTLLPASVPRGVAQLRFLRR
ncbi:MAG TPA: PQQ-dependent sugar dehydrogenase [Fibrobacteria bacterium]|nr:PQQ-dependent sugar dehydrogenase [Fibrobacteria bacterium]